MSIYDNLANSDYVDAGQFKEQLKNIQTLKESTEFKHTDDAYAAHNDKMKLRDFDLPGQYYDGGLASLRQQQDMNPMDQVENEQSLLRKQPDPADAAWNGSADSLRFQNMMKQASEQKEQFKKRTLNRETLGEDDFDLEYQRDAAAQARHEQSQTPYDQLVEQRNKMIFDNDDDRQDNDYADQAPYSGPVTIAQNPQQQFTLNKYESRPSLKDNGKIHGGSVEVDSEDPQVQTAHFNKHANPSSHKSEIARTGTEQTQRDSRHGKRGAPTRAADGHMIDQRAIDDPSEFQVNQFEDSEQRKRAQRVQQLMAEQHADWASRQRGYDGEGGTGQFGGGKDTHVAGQAQSRREKSAERRRQLGDVQVQQFKPTGAQLDPVLEASPQVLKNRLDEDNEKINQILAQLQAPMHLSSSQKKQDPLGQSRDASYPLDLEQAHNLMQESIKQLKFVGNETGNAANLGMMRQQSSDQYSAGLDDSKRGAFNGQSSLYDLANKAGHPTLNTSSNVNSVANEAEFHKLFNVAAGEEAASVVGSANFNQKNDMINLAGTEDPRYAQKMLEEQPSQSSDLMAQLNYRNFMPPSELTSAAGATATDAKQQFSNSEHAPVHHGKENFNEVNQFVVTPQAQAVPLEQPQRRPMSLAERAAQAKLAALKQKQEYQRQQPQMQQQQPPQYYRQQFVPNFDGAPKSPNYATQNTQEQPFDFKRSQLGQAVQAAPSRPSYGTAPQQVDFSQTDHTQKAQKRQQLLLHIDDIPIHQLHKADGYQVRNLGEEEQAPPRSKSPMEEADDAEGLNLKDRCFHKNWKVRSTAFKDINRLMLTYQPAEREHATKEDLMYGDNDNPFDVYGPLIDQMIKDSNLSAQYDGLNCLLTYVRLNQGDIKSVVQTCCSLMLDKLQLAKPAYKEATSQILQVMLQRRQSIVSDLLKRFKSVNPKMSSFCFENIIKAFEERSLHLQDANLKMMFKCTHDMLAHSSRELRDHAHALMAHIYENCEDELNVFCANVKSLRPIQLKELRDILAEHQKNTRAEYLVRLFTGEAANQALAADEKDDDRSRSREPVRGDHAGAARQQPSALEQEETVDLFNVVPENFSELPRLTQIKQKQKGMEAFNHELEKLRQKAAGEVIIKSKDYSSIFNVTSSLLEDPNMLVFIEAIKTVEHLAALLRSSLKKEKGKQFLTLLADKYKENKTAVLAALSSVFEVILQSKCLSPALFFDILVSQISHSHKNPRVRQMVLERVFILIGGPDEMASDFGSKTALSVFKVIKDKLGQIILKDTNAQVRDLAANLLTLFSMMAARHAGDGQGDEPAQLSTMVNEVIDKLPQRRQAEIKKRVDEAVGQGPSASVDHLQPPETDRERASRSRGYSSKRGKSGNKSSERSKRPSDLNVDEDGAEVKRAAGGVSPLKSAASGSESQLFHTKKAQANVSGRFQASLSDVVMTIKNVGQDRDRLRVSQIQQNLDAALDDLSSEGIQECKQQIVTCVYWLLTQYPNKVNFLQRERQESVRAVLTFLKRLYQVERSISTAATTQDGDPLELHQAICCVQLCYALLHEDPQSTTLLNHLLDSLLTATQLTSLPILAFVNIMKKTMLQLEAPCPLLIPHGRALMISNSLYFLSDKLEQIIAKSRKQQYDGYAMHSVELRDFEDLRTITIQLMEQDVVAGDANKQMLVQALVYLKDKMMVQMRADSGETGPLHEERSPAADPRDQRPATADPQIHLIVVQQLTEQFEKGLLLLKDLVRDEQNGVIPALSFEQKEAIVKVLLKMTTEGYQNPNEQYKQAYSLKAVMWLREEFIGLEDTFKLASRVMAIYAQACIDGKDSSIESYLLNQWTRELSLRDLVDRTQHTLRYEYVPPESSFPPLLDWMIEQRLQLNDGPDWYLDDFRKLAMPLAAGLLRDNERRKVMLRFTDLCIDKFGAKKMREFMEIQLMHENNILMRFLDFFDLKYGFALKQEANASEMDHLKISQTNQVSGDESLAEPLLTNRSGAQNTSRLQEKRDQMKMANANQSEAEFAETLASEKRKYEEIMKKLDDFRRGKPDHATEEQQPRAETSMDKAAVGVELSAIKRQSATSKGRADFEHNAVAGAGRLTHQEVATMSQFNDEEDFRLSTDHQQSIAQLGGLHSQKSSVLNLHSKKGLATATMTDEDEPIVPQHQMQMRANGPSYQSTQALGEGLRSKVSYEALDGSSPSPNELGGRSIQGSRRKDDGQLKLDQLTNSVTKEVNDNIIVASRQKIKDSVANQEEKLQRLESSQIKTRQYRNEVDMLNAEKQRLEHEMHRLMQEQNRETGEWRRRHDEIVEKNADIAASLADANEQYLSQVQENERLSSQIMQMQQEHREFLRKYRELEEKLADSQKEVEEQRQRVIEESLKNEQLAASTSASPSRISQNIVQEKQLLMIEQVFDRDSSDSQAAMCIKRIQELLLDSDEGSQNLAKPLSFHYQKLKSKEDRAHMLYALKQALDNEDILFAIASEQYRSLLNFLLRAFSFEKELIERESLATQHEREVQNELTQEAQRLISKLLNSKEFTTSLICLIQLLKSDAMPSDFNVQLTIQQRHYLRVTMRCINRITKALHSESPDLVRAFDVLNEMQKMFVKHPPENLRQDLPCLADFDYVYRGLKDVSDKMIELQPQKCIAFLDFCNREVRASASSNGGLQINAFVKYLSNVLSQSQQ